MGGWISAFAGMSGTSHTLSAVIAGLDPAIHEAVQQCWQYCARGISSWMPPNSGLPEFGNIGLLQVG